MGDRLRVGIPSRYVTSQLGQLSLASLRGRLIKCQHRRGKGGNITSARWQVTLWVPTWHVSFRSGVATYRTAILVTFKQVVLLQYRQTSQKLSMSSTKITWCIFSLEEKRALTTKELIFLNWQPKCQVNYFKNWNKCSKFGAMHVYSLPKCTEYKYKQLFIYGWLILLWQWKVRTDAISKDMCGQ